MKPAVFPALFLLLPVVASCTAKSEPTDFWREGPELPQVAGQDGRFEAFLASGARLLLVGGIVGSGTDTRSAAPTSAVSLLADHEWTDGPPLPAAAAKHHLAAAMLNNELYVVGGFDGIIGRGLADDAFRPVSAAFVLKDGAWLRLADAPLARGGATAAALRRRIHVLGGAKTEGQPPFGDHFAYDVDEHRWIERAPLPTAREHLASCVVGGKVLVVGGWVGPSNVAQAVAELYDPERDAWERVADMPTARGGLAAVSIGERCHVLGGEDWSLPLPGTFTAHEVFDLKTRAWSKAAPLPRALHGLGAAAYGGEIWVVGGGPQLGNSYTRASNVYRP